jgi:DNA (cytosine-5)-methyltransferase 1
VSAGNKPNIDHLIRARYVELGFSDEFIAEIEAFTKAEAERLKAARRPVLLDLFCGAGGASMGYRSAGFDVVGVDLSPQPNYPFEFHQADALTFPLDGFDAIHASPPCQSFTAYKRRPNHVGEYPNLIAPVRDRLVAAGVPWVIENVPKAPLRDPVQLCGSSFGLDVRRHRLFESNYPLTAPPCDHSWQTPRFPPATNRVNLRRTVEVGVWRIPLAVQHAAMGVDWMTLEELSEAIPPAYTEHLGRQLLEVIR